MGPFGLSAEVSSQKILIPETLSRNPKCKRASLSRTYHSASECTLLLPACIRSCGTAIMLYPTYYRATEYYAAPPGSLCLILAARESSAGGEWLVASPEGPYTLL